MSAVIKDLADGIKVFTDRVRAEHKESSDNQKEILETQDSRREEHREMISQLKEVTTILGRINGYKP